MSQLSENTAQLSTLFADASENLQKFIDKDNVSAAFRARKSLLELGKLTKVVRKDIQNQKKALKEAAKAAK